ncbi:MAG: low temperature requirement protein A [Solirubrobacteraceae bacterium]
MSTSAAAHSGQRSYRTNPVKPPDNIASSALQAHSPEADAAIEAVVRVSTLELFFDLVFVFTITQLTTVFANHATARGLLQVVLMFGVIWWMYGGYAWLTNAVAPDRPLRRLLLMGGMAAFLVLALAIPRAFSGSGVAFGLAYLAVVCVHAGLFASTASEHIVRAVLGISRFNLVTALLVLVGGIVGATAEYLLWAAALLFAWTTPKLIDDSGFEIAPAHFVERHGLVVIITIGESIVAIGVVAAGLPVNLALVGVALLGLALSACLWWTHFGGDEERAERALSAAPREQRPRLAVNAFGYWHLPILFGVLAIAAAEKRATGHGFAHLRAPLAAALAGGVAVFLLGDVLFRRSLGIGRARGRAIVAVLALATVPLGTEISAAAQMARTPCCAPGAGLPASRAAARCALGSTRSRRTPAWT